MFEDSVNIIARKILLTDDLDKDNWGVRKLRIEARLLAWFKRSSKLPTPGLLSPLAHSLMDEPDADRTFFIIEKLPGVPMLNQYGLLNTKAKERTVQSYAHFCLEMFRLKVPPKIGLFVPGISSTSSDDVVPAITVQSRFRDPTKTFDDIQEYFDFLLEMKKHSYTIGGDGRGHLDELEVHINAILDNLTSKKSAHSLSRCVLVHADLNDMNILVDERGQITGIIDWE
ncbi:hypothetical protein C0989_001369 [Termitomyces sp. Mn162]|nr:hypothetical protein C0989_001369 [Termitomyces sp. Mn162]